MPERTITDDRGDRWDVEQVEENGARLVFRHMSGRRVTLEGDRALDAYSNDQLKRLLRESGRDRPAGEDQPGGERAADPEGYVTRPEASDRP